MARAPCRQACWRTGTTRSCRTPIARGSSPIRTASPSSRPRACMPGSCSTASGRACGPSSSIAAVDAADADDDVRVVIVTGEGRGFCAGADLSGGGETFDWRERAGAGDVPRDGGGRVVLRVHDSMKPVIAAINGPAVGVGITMTLPMDIRLIGQHAKIGFVFASRGIVPEAASSWFLPRLVGISQAMEWVATGRAFDADEALRGGLVRSVHGPDDL